jgi:predicted DCC family thiol-disulfide oxidoreductase YuxK
MRFGAKQGKTFQHLLQNHPELANVESVVLVERRADGGEDFLVRSAAIREVIKGLPEFRLFEIALRIFPDFISDIGYRIFSKLRAPLFGKWHHCRVPLEQDRELYVD